MEEPNKAPEASASPSARVGKLLEEMTALHAKGQLQALQVGYVRADGGAVVQSTPMSPVMLNHLSKLLERRVSREYDRALAQASAPAAGTGAGAVPETPRNSVAAKLPRKVRRQVEKAQRKAAKKAVPSTPTAEPVIRRPPTAN